LVDPLAVDEGSVRRTQVLDRQPVFVYLDLRMAAGGVWIAHGDIAALAADRQAGFHGALGAHHRLFLNEGELAHIFGTARTPEGGGRGWSGLA
jgi:hypothetical protein